MRIVMLSGLGLVVVLASDTSAQFHSIRRASAGTSSVSTVPSVAPGGFLGSDACSSPHTPAGSGDVLGVPFTTGTTGTQGQSEADCYAFGMTGIDNDVWYDWTADMSGNATVSTCSGTSVDTKIAVWPDNSPSSCPADGSSLGCNDDACGLQSIVTWSVIAGSTYTIQLGTFPGGTGGSGTFDIVQSFPPLCGQYDDGTSEGALGAIAGGETGWLLGFTCLDTVESVEAAYGTPLGSPPPNGTAASIHVYEDSDCDENPATPASGMTTLWSITTTVTNASTDILNHYPVTPAVTVSSGCSFVMAASNQASGEFPAPMDQTNPTPASWVVASTLGPDTLDTDNLNNNNVAPLQMQAIGFPCAFLLRAQGRDCMTACLICQLTGDPAACDNCASAPCMSGHPTVCFGASGCPCGNDGDGLGGCQHTLGTGGTILAGTGAASLSNDTLVLTATRTRNAPGIFFQGDTTHPSPPTFGDGLRCCGVNVVRIGTYLPTGNTTDTATGNLIGGFGPPISALPGNAGLSAGDTRCYQYWHRDPPAGVCGSGFNLSNAVQATWTL